jgi:Skp family chaperone for outer membrane proteins
MRSLNLLSFVAMTSLFAAPAHAQIDGIKGVGTRKLAAESGKPSAVADRLDRLKERVLALCADKSLSYHKLLHDASHVVREAALDQRWDSVQAALENQHMPKIFHRRNEHTTRYEYLVDRNAWIDGEGTAHSLYLAFTVDNRDLASVPLAKTGHVMVAAAGLLAEPNRPYESVLISKAYPEGSVVFVGLRLPKLASAARTYPIVKRIEVTYDFIRDRWLDNVEQGFQFDVTLGTSALDDRKGKRAYFTVTSGLDGPQDWDGKPLDQAFKPQDTIGKFRSWGGSEWRRSD